MTRLLGLPILFGIAIVASSDAAGADAPAVPKELAVPAGHKEVAAVRAKGVQIYASVADKGGKFVWELEAPLAELTDAKGDRIGYHFAGPVWEAADGSRLVRDEAEKPKAVPRPDAIPWLLVRVKSDAEKPGTLSAVVYVQRLETKGGQAPADAPKRAGTKVGIPYEAKYVFFAPIEKK